MFREGIAPDEAEDAGGLDARQGRQRSTAQFLPEQVKDFYGSSVSESRVRRGRGPPSLRFRVCRDGTLPSALLCPHLPVGRHPLMPPAAVPAASLPAAMTGAMRASLPTAKTETPCRGAQCAPRDRREILSVLRLTICKTLINCQMSPVTCYFVVFAIEPSGTLWSGWGTL